MRSMKIIIVSAVLLCFGAGIANSKEISRGQAEQIATGWMAEKFAVAESALPARDELTCTDIERGRRTIAYLFEVPEAGFVLVAGDDRFGPVIAYSEKNGFDPDIPPAKSFLDVVGRVINNGPASTEESTGQTTDVGKIGPLVETQWSQGWPYNKYCPTTYCVDEDGDCKPCSTPVGCVAVAMAQIMRYHRYPPRGIGSHEYEWTCEKITCADGTKVDGYCEKTTIYVNFEINHDWSNMPVSLDGSSSDAQIDAVSKLLYHCGVAVDMDYACNGSCAYSSDVRDALKTYFNYQSSAEYTGRDFDSEKWFAILTDEIIGGRPVYYRGTHKETDEEEYPPGHAFILDGVDDSLGDQLFVHINYGWGGAGIPLYCPDGDGWYEMGFFCGFTQYHAVILGIQPREGGWTISPSPNAPNSPGLRPQSGGNCFVATAVYGCPCCRQVKILSAFRDSCLLTNAPGRFFVKNYYRFSPRLVRTIRNKPLVKKAVRFYLKPFVFLARLLVSDR